MIMPGSPPARAWSCLASRTWRRTDEYVDWEGQQRYDRPVRRNKPALTFAARAIRARKHFN
jgi:hypothetical protein